MPVPPLPPKVGSTAPPSSGSAAPDTSLSADQQLEQEIAHLRSGALVYQPPPKMKTGETRRITARIGSTAVSTAALEQGMDPSNGGPITKVDTPITTRMKMTLTGAEFNITPLSTEEQFVAGTMPTTWAWDISPKHSGKLDLHLAAIVELNGLSRDYTTVDKDIAVTVDPVNAAKTFLQANGVWVLTTLGVGLSTAFAWWRKRRKGSAASPVPLSHD